MRLLGRRGRQRHNQLCRASPAECHQERRESPARPFHNFSIGRHLWFGPLRSPPQQKAVLQQIECRSDRSKIFACDFPPVVVIASDPRQCSPAATVRSGLESRELFEKKALREMSWKLKRKARGAKSPAPWTIVNTLTTYLSAWRATSDGGGRAGTRVIWPSLGHAGLESSLIVECF